MDEYQVGDAVEVLDPGLESLRRLCPGMPPNHHGRVHGFSGPDLMVEFPLDGGYSVHSQVSPYPREMVRKRTAIRGENIPATGHHDAGAIARCSYCGRYTENKKALQYDPQHESPKDLRCNCGKTHGWSGSFVRPTAESVWSD